MVPGAQLTIGYRRSQLLAWASAEDHQMIRSAIEQLESQGLTERGLVLEVHHLKGPVADTARSVVEDALPNVRFVAGSQPEKMFVWARPEDHKAIDAIIKALEAEAVAEGEKVIAAYALEKVEVTTARQVLQESVQDLTYLDSGDPRKLLILAAPARQETVKQTLERLEKSAPAPEPTSVRVYPLGTVDPATIDKALDPKLLEGVSVIPDSIKNRLIVRTTDARHAEIKAALDKAVPELPPEEKPESRVYRLKNSDPQAARAVLATLVPYATLAVDTVNRSLVVTAVPTDHEQIQQTVQQLEEVAGTEAPETRVYAFRSGDPQTALTLLQRLLPEATLAVDVQARTLAATVRPSDHQRIKAAVEQLDRPGREGYETRVYRFRKGNASAAQYPLRSMMPDATLSADYYNNVLIATARIEDHAKIQAVVDKIDGGDGTDQETRVYRLAGGDPNAAQTALASLLPQATVVADSTSRTIIVTASAADHKTIEEIVQKMDRAGGQGYETQVHRLRKGSAYSVATALRTLLPNANVIADYQNNTVIATADANDQKRISSVIQQMDRAGLEGFETKVYRFDEGMRDVCPLRAAVAVARRHAGLGLPRQYAAGHRQHRGPRANRRRGQAVGHAWREPASGPGVRASQSRSSGGVRGAAYDVSHGSERERLARRAEQRRAGGGQGPQTGGSGRSDQAVGQQFHGRRRYAQGLPAG